MSTVILSYPFSGSVYAFIDSCLKPEWGGKHRLNQCYYRTLFGPEDSGITDVSLSLFVLFDEIMLVAADTALPDYKTYEVDGIYKHPDLGLTASWHHYHRSREITDELVQLYLEDAQIKQILKRVPDQAKHQILGDVRHELDLATEFHAPVICSRGREALLHRVSQLDLSVGSNSSAVLETPNTSKAKEYVQLVGPIFNPLQLDDLVTIKHDKDVRKFAGHFADEVFGSKKEGELGLIDRIDSSILRAHQLEDSANYFEIGSRALDIASIPLGPLAALLGKSVEYAGEKRKQELERTKWYEFGPEIRKAQSLAELKRKVADRKGKST